MNETRAIASDPTPAMIIRHYRVRFLTPAFLGDAHQDARWRTPPFKHLLREWWRVAWFADHADDFRLADMRREEGLLFGFASPDDEKNQKKENRAREKARKSLIRLRLDNWAQGTMKQWNEKLDAVRHPEVRHPVGSDLYLGYGPLIYDKGSRGAALKSDAAIAANESASLGLAMPTTHADETIAAICRANVSRMERAITLINHFGAVGGRSRNGWGSLALEGQDDEAPDVNGVLPIRPWEDCLAPDCDWPHAIGKDETGPLIWQTPPGKDWQAIMQGLARIKIALRTQFKFPQERPDGQVHDRHWLAYPITKHSVKRWGRNARLPNTLRFKIIPANDGRLIGRIFHLPHLPPKAFGPIPEDIRRVWQKVYEHLDSDSELTRRQSL